MWRNYFKRLLSESFGKDLSLTTGLTRTVPQEMVRGSMVVFELLPGAEKYVNRNKRGMVQTLLAPFQCFQAPNDTARTLVVR